MPSDIAKNSNDQNDRLTAILDAYNSGEPNARDELWSFMLKHCNAIIKKRRNRLRLQDGDTTGDVISKVFLKMVKHGEANWVWKTPLDVYNTIATVARSVVGELRERYSTDMRDRSRVAQVEVSLVENWLSSHLDHDPNQYTLMGKLMDRLKTEHPELHEPIYLHYYTGMLIKDIATSMELSRQMIRLRMNKAEKIMYRWSQEAA